MYLLILGELIFLSVLSHRLTQNLFTAVFLLTKSRPVAVSFLSILFFPGTVIHELSHLFTAEILGVKTDGLTLVPESIEQKEVRTGSVSIAKSDPFRRSIIGIAPVFAGLGALGVVSYFLPQLEFPLVLILYYLLFAVSNTMFASKEDLEGFWPLVLVLGLLVTAAYIAGIRLTLTEPVLSSVIQFFRSVAINLGYVTGLNIGLFGLSTLLIRGVEKVTKRRVSSPLPPGGPKGLS